MNDLTLDDADHRFSTVDLCEHLVSRIDAAEVKTDPFAHFIVDEALPKDFYTAFAASIPERACFESVTPGSTRSTDHTLVLSYNEYASRSAAHRAVFDKIRKVFDAASRRIATKFEPHIELAFGEIFGDRTRECLDEVAVEHVPVANLYERLGTFEQPPHLDGCFRLASWLFYIPVNTDVQIRGTDIYRTLERTESFDPLRCMYLRTPRGLKVERVSSVSFVPNRILAFVNSPFSFHGVSRSEPDEADRGRRITMLNWIEMSKASTERIYARALFDDRRGQTWHGNRSFTQWSDLQPDGLEFATDVGLDHEGRIVTRKAQWSYAAWLAFKRPGAEPKTCHLRLRMAVDDGEIGIGLQNENSDDFLDEVTVMASPNRRVVDLVLPDGDTPLRLMFRNVSAVGASSFRFESASIVSEA